MPRLSLKHISETTGGDVLGAGFDPASVLATGYAFDSRRLEPGDLFFALRGEERDGHLFVKQAHEQGAVGAVVEHPVEGIPSQFPQVAVPSTLEALRVLAADVRGHIKIPVVAVSGSNGKTTTKEMLAAILSTRWKVLKSPGNFNNHIGVPMSILGLREDHEVLVVELGSNHRGEIASLSETAAPTIGVLTNIGPAHIGHFGSLDEIALEKTDLLRHLAEGGMGVVNGDDKTLAAATGDIEARITRFGTGEGMDFRATEIETYGAGGTAFHVGDAEVTLRVPGIHNVYNALAAMAAAALLDLGLEEAARALEGFQPVRMKTFALGGVTIIDDTYNANPDSVRAALDLLADYAGDRKVFVMGEMLELGEESPRLHRETGRRVAARGIDMLVGIGGATEEVVAGARDAGMPGDRVRFFAAKPDAGAFLTQMLKPGDVVLLKGSRGTALEEITDYLRQELVEGRT
jgi:UDP-N-acetylmuramoyl-tripeptide--D-alanyl-D-alanine ligase